MTSGLRGVLGAVWLIGQIYIVQYPMLPMLQRPLHLLFALALVILWSPLDVKWIDKRLAQTIDFLMVVFLFVAAAYYFDGVNRLTERMYGIDSVPTLDLVIGVVATLIVLEASRRCVGWSLLGVILAFLFYAFTGPLFPGWLKFQGFVLPDLIESLTMTPNGLLGVTTATSLQFVFYFVAFGAFYSAIGGSQLFIDIGLRWVGTHKGGAAKAAVISSGMMGTISGSAVANVVATGVFTIPLMRRTGLSAERAAATEAIASTGGQLMPPIMGIAAFVMAELLQVDYGRIALAGIIPGVAFYMAIFMSVDLHARKTGLGTITREETIDLPPIVPRLYLLTPPLVLVGLLIYGYSATFSAVGAILACVATSYVRRQSWMTPRGLMQAIRDAAKQAAQVAVPIAAIGIIIEIAVQSNLALKFSSRLMEISGGNLIVAMVMVIFGCVIMGMGLPTVAAYIIGAILFVPALLKLGIPELSAHFFVMYYCVLSMVTPPVALASYAAAGLANANTMKTGLLAFRMSIVSFFIPFAFAFDTALLGFGPLWWIAMAFASTMIATAAWAAALVGYLHRPMNLVERVILGAASAIVIFSPTGHSMWSAGIAVLMAMAIWCFVLHPRSGRANAGAGGAGGD